MGAKTFSKKDLNSIVTSKQNLYLKYEFTLSLYRVLLKWREKPNLKESKWNNIVVGLPFERSGIADPSTEATK